MLYDLDLIKLCIGTPKNLNFTIRDTVLCVSATISIIIVDRYIIIGT